MALPPVPGNPAQAGLSGLFGNEPGVSVDQLMQQAAADEKMINRDPPDPDEKRKALVAGMADAVKHAKKHWDKPFKRMREDQDFVYGKQWSKNVDDKRYIANITLRTISQRVAYLYAKNPKAVAKRREMMLNTVWDGTQTQLQSMQQATAAAMGGAGGDPSAPPPPPEAVLPIVQQGMAIAQDATFVHESEALLDKVSKTLELLYAYNVAQQLHPFKQLMKMTVRRACTLGVAYVKLGFERVMEKRPDVVAKLSDINERLGTLERLAADLADGEMDKDNSAEAEQLQLMLKEMMSQQEFTAREGLVFDYPSSYSIIPDTKCIKLRGFLGCDWVAEEYILSPNEVKEIYSVDVGKNYTSYKRPDMGMDIITRANSMMSLSESQMKGKGNDKQCCCVWELYNRKDGLVYVLCDGYKDFLREPAGPDTPLDRFWPWFTLTFNDIEHEDEVFPPSDVRLMRDMQLDYNRARQGMREHRRAARPKTVTAAGALDEEDLAKLENHPDNAILELNGLQPGQKVEDLLQPFTGPKIDPALYDVAPYFEDTLRTTGIQEANMGPTNADTATQSQIAEASRTTTMDSNIDDLDDLLTHLAKYGGQLLLSNVQEDTVKRVVGPGAIWPELTRQQISEEIWLEVEAGSSGKPNQAADIANAQKIYPLLMQIPGVSPEFLAKDLIGRLDDKLDLTQAFKPMLPSIVAMNTAFRGQQGAGGGGGMGPQTQPGGGGEAPQLQGSQGQDNSPQQPRPGGDMPPPTPGPASGNPAMPAPGMGRLPGPTH